MFFKDNSEAELFESYAMMIGIPITRWWSDMWVQAYSLLYGVSTQEALAAIQKRNAQWQKRSRCHCHCR